MNNQIKDFIDYRNKIGDRTKMYENVVKKYKVNSILYPGSHIDITPSLLVSKVIYVDNFMGTRKFFKERDAIYDYISSQKKYKENPDYTYIYEDYERTLDIQKVDMIISQFAGFVGQATKRYLKKDGVLLANDSHGDATLAFFDDDYLLIGVITKCDELKTKELSKYFKF